MPFSLKVNNSYMISLKTLSEANQSSHPIYRLVCVSFPDKTTCCSWLFNSTPHPQLTTLFLAQLPEHIRANELIQACQVPHFFTSKCPHIFINFPFSLWLSRKMSLSFFSSQDNRAWFPISLLVICPPIWISFMEIPLFET